MRGYTPVHQELFGIVPAEHWFNFFLRVLALLKPQKCVRGTLSVTVWCLHVRDGQPFACFPLSGFKVLCSRNEVSEKHGGTFSSHDLWHFSRTKRDAENPVIMMNEEWFLKTSP